MNCSRIMFARKYHIEIIASRGRITRKPAGKLNDKGTRYKQDTTFKTAKKDHDTKQCITDNK